MNRSSKGFVFAVMGLIFFVVTSVRAAIILPNLPSGSQYQLVFVTADGRTASSSNIADYNTFVSQEAALNPSLPSTTWRAIASTPTVNAITNAPTSASIPIYNTHGQLVANGTSDFWYPAHLAAINYDQYGIQESSQVWTGSNPNGTAANPFSQVNVTIALCTTYASSGWINDYAAGSSNSVPLYGLSSPITVPEPNLAIVAVFLAHYRFTFSVKLYGFEGKNFF